MSQINLAPVGDILDLKALALLQVYGINGISKKTLL